MPLIKIPDEYICPITLSLIKDPVTIDEDQTGRLYERSAIQNHFKTKNTIPYTNGIAKSKELKTNFFAKKAIKDFLEKNQICTSKQFFDAIKSGKMEEVEKLDIPEDYLNAKDEKAEDMTPLHYAAKEGYIEIVKFLLKHKVNVNVRDEEYPKLSEITEDEELSHSPLHLAAESGHADIMQLLLDSGAHINARGIFKMTPLHASARMGHIDATKLLLARGAFIFTKDADQGATPLCFAAYGGHAEIVKLLLDAGAEIEEKTYPGSSWVCGGTALHIAALQGKGNIVRLLMERGANTKALTKPFTISLALAKGLKEHTEYTPAQLAAEKGHEELSKNISKWERDIKNRINECPNRIDSLEKTIQEMQKQIQQLQAQLIEKEKSQASQEDKKSYAPNFNFRGNQ